MNSSIYNEKYLENTLSLISDNLNELVMWSAYNDDKKLEEIMQLRDLYKTIKQQLLK